MRKAFYKQHLIDLGFVGFQPLHALAAGCPQVPSSSGVYAVVLEPVSGPAFLERSIGGHFKRADPTVPVETLAAKWVDHVPTLYIGRATSLRSRLALLVRYGRGEPVGHRGGRYLWQLARSDELEVAWRPDADPVGAESSLLDAFESAYGRLPFANLVRGSRVPAYA